MSFRRFRRHMLRRIGGTKVLATAGLVAVALVVVTIVAGALGSNDTIELKPGEDYTTLPPLDLKPPPVAALSEPDDPRLLIMGDSFTQGSNADPVTDGFAFVVGRELGWETVVEGEGGVGYYANGAKEKRLLTRIRKYDSKFEPNVLLLAAGANDSSASEADFRRLFLATVEAAQEKWPGVQVVVVGPFYEAGRTAVMTPLSYEAGSVMIRPIDDAGTAWISAAEQPDLISYDGYHPNTEGHTLIAEKLVAALRDSMATAEERAAEED